MRFAGWVGGGLTGPSPKSFSGFWKEDMVAIAFGL